MLNTRLLFLITGITGFILLISWDDPWDLRSIISGGSVKLSFLVKERLNLLSSTLWTKYDPVPKPLMKLVES